jgi:hypothetical protein
VPPADGANLVQQRALKLRIDEQDQPIVPTELDEARFGLSLREIAIGPVFEPHIFLVASTQPPSEDAALQLSRGLTHLLGRDLLLMMHAVQHAERGVIGVRGMLQGIAIVGLGQHADQKGRFRQIQLLNPDAEIIARGVVEARQVARMRHRIEITRQNLLTREDRRNPHREHGLQHLALEAVLFLQQQRPGKLLGDGAAALTIAAKRMPRRPERGAEVERAM